MSSIPTNRRKYPQADVKLLYGRAAARCAFPNCRRDLTLPATAYDPVRQIGHIAHIYPHATTRGPRSHVPHPCPVKSDSYCNWILLCPNCHALIDNHDSAYTPVVLQELKENHERWVTDNLKTSMSTITYSELEVAINALVSHLRPSDVSFSLTHLETKILINDLSPASQSLISIGLMQGKQVKDILTHFDQADVGFALKLTAYFKHEYTRLTSDPTMDSDAIFSALLNFAAAGKTDFSSQAAGLALLVHFFESCEVFSLDTTV